VLGAEASEQLPRSLRAPLDHKHYGGEHAFMLAWFAYQLSSE
jgi:hypothetical protein